MQSKFVDGKGTLAMVKADASIFQQCKYLLNFISRNLAEDDSDQQGIRNSAACLQALCERFGPKYLDDKGQLIESQRKSLVDEAIPK